MVVKLARRWVDLSESAGDFDLYAPGELEDVALALPLQLQYLFT